MARKGVEDMINEIEIFIDNCKYQPLSSNKIVVQKDEIESMINELKIKMPGEVDRCKKIMRNKEAILADARTRSDAIIAAANDEAKKLVDESEIVELANIRANEIVEMAREEASQIIEAAAKEADEVRLGSMLYTKDTLLNIDSFLKNTLEAEKTNYNNLLASLQGHQDVIAANMREIEDQINEFSDESPRVKEPIVYATEPENIDSVFGAGTKAYEESYEEENYAQEGAIVQPEYEDDYNTDDLSETQGQVKDNLNDSAFNEEYYDDSFLDE